ncbi:tRNA threonylcarbamoyl adenosine modification protein YeaZ [Sphingomonas sp. YR710]|uniref:tRNA (adenosine(37)-N6)-threonylcarbamoyltransferase complex dimerization subunit type 1 TsaB n=1 Tax=Sphingomonas sp. YR710 TaxID=1882773 RepID=UPI000882E927|nr:tRNA (adenosine(37)-N6)-threonylcarbamoyltransferase complex dimerization subunit type 1 TsaB [Sphingomonas sp. YR710]SDD43907.1 tRNA threonylcarbamoyl adenosine modification protein YeaZ [Sphingomonas sp. YR710]
MSSCLVIDTATAACSVALFDGARLIAGRHDVVGRGHSEQLMPMIAGLPGGGRADRILVDCGPGSFTGVRVGIAAARALAFGWGVPVHGYSSMSLIAAMAAPMNGETIAVAVIGGHGEIFVQRFSADPVAPLNDLASLTPAEAASQIRERRIHGSGAHMLTGARMWGDADDVLPNAANAMMMPPSCADLPPQPIYGRGADAKPIAT